jgi:capsular exopolysaccharide synthesis family protein
VTNTIVRSFIDRSYQTRHEAIIRSTEWLERQLDDIRGKMDASNRALAVFQGVSGIADVDQYRSTFTEQLAELSKEKTQALSDRIAMQSFLSQVRNGNPEMLPQVQGDQVVQIVTQRLGEVRGELSQTLAIYGKNHPNAKRLQNEVEELQSQIKLQQKAIIGEMQTKYAAALSRETLINNQLRSTSKEVSQMAQYTALKKEAQTNADLYNALYSRVKEAGITAASKSINIRVVDQARVLDTPTRPQPLINLGLGFCVALIGGIFLALIREAFDHRIHTIQDVRQFIGVYAVSILPMAEGSGHSTLGSFGSLFGSDHPRRLLDGPTNFLLDEPGSEQSEAFRGIHTSVMLSQPGGAPHALLVGSSLPGEGKTTVAINLAVALARHGKTCILDADLRRPSVGRAFNVTVSDGLSEYLAQSVSLDSILTPVPRIEGLTVIAAGKAITNPGTLANLDNMRLLIHDLREMYDFVIIDSPPILPYSDGRALAPFVDGVVFVGRAGVVTREAMSRSIELLEEVHSAPILEVVLNGANANDNSYGYRYSYSDYPSH